LLERLAGLPLAQSAFHQGSRRPCEYNTRVDLLEQLQFDIKDARTRVVWLQGSPGQGKTAIATSLCFKLRSAQIPVVSFFFSGADDMEKFAGTIARQLARFSPEFRDALIDVIDQYEPSTMHDETHEIEQLVITPAKTARWPAQVAIVLDGLELCKDLPKLMNLVGKLRELPPTLAIFISSRNTQDVKRFFQETPEQSRSLHVLDNLDSRADLRGFLRSELSRRRYLGGLGSRYEAKVDEFVDGCEGSFVVASELVDWVECDFASRFPEQVVVWLLEDVCGSILEAACHHDQYKTLAGALVTVLEPMTRSSLEHLLGEKFPEDGVLQCLSQLLVEDENSLLRLCSPCRKLLLSDSYRLLRRATWGRVRPQHEKLLERCLTDPKAPDYGGRMWIKHLEAIDIDKAEKVPDILRRFLENDLISWLDSVNSDDARGQCTPPSVRSWSALYMPSYRNPRNRCEVV